MATDVVVPEVGETGMDVTLVRWCKQPGDAVAVGDILFELDTDKTVVEVEAWTTGTLGDLRVEAGDVVAPRQVIASILAPGESREDPPVENASSAPIAEATPGTGPSSPVPGASPPSVSQAGSGAPVMASPRARRLAAEHGVDIATIGGSGSDGLVTERDVLAAVEAADTA